MKAKQPNSATAASLLSKAQAFEKMGDTQRAVELYDALLKKFPGHKNARISIQRLLNPPDQTIKRLLSFYQSHEFNRCISEGQKLLPSFPKSAILNNLIGVAAQTIKNGDLAKRSYLAALEFDPNFPEPANNLGILYSQTNNLDLSREYFLRALKISPNNPKFSENLALLAETYGDHGDYSEAINTIEECLRYAPNNPKLFSAKGMFLSELGNLEGSLECFDKALSLSPMSPDNHANKGLSAYRMNQLELSSICAETALALDQNHEGALNLKGLLCLKRDDPAQALSVFENILLKNPANSEAQINKGCALIEERRFEDALNSIEFALTTNPNSIDALISKGAALQGLARFEDALRTYDRALELAPKHAGVFSNRGNTLSELGRYSEAIKDFDSSLSLDPKSDNALWNKSLVSLLLGDFKTGWNLYESRWKKAHPDTYLFPERPALEDLRDVGGKNIVVWCEQGLGDTIQFSRYVKQLQALNATVTFLVQKSLLKLISKNFTCKVIDGSDVGAIKNFEYHVPIMSLPRLFHTNLTNIPEDGPYIKAGDGPKDAWRQRLDLSSKKLNIGLAISGNPKQVRNHIRSINIENLLPILGEANFFLIQKEVSPRDREIIKSEDRIHFLGNQIGDFTDTAAILANMDIVVSVCTSLIHLAGAMGFPSYLLSAWTPDWRWSLHRADSPWYPSVKILRQQRPGDWPSVVTALGSELNNVLKPNPDTV